MKLFAFSAPAIAQEPFVGGYEGTRDICTVNYWETRVLHGETLAEVVSRLRKVSGQEITLDDVQRSSVDTETKCEGKPLEEGELVSYTFESCLYT